MNNSRIVYFHYGKGEVLESPDILHLLSVAKEFRFAYYAAEKKY